VNGLTQHLCLDEKYYEHNKHYIGGNIDAMLNLSSLIAGANPKRFFEVTAFVGPMISVAKSQNVAFTVDAATGETSKALAGDEKTRARIGASAGLGLKFNLSKYWAIDVEARGAVAPSIFGNISSHRKAEGTGMLTAGVSYIFGGKKFVKGGSKEVVKEVPVEVIKEVPTEVVKEVVKEVPSTAAAAIFFKINKTEISEEGMVNVKLMAKTMKANPSTKYQIAGYADKGTGTESINQTLSEKRAQAVYDALIAEGVSADQLEKVAMGGTDPMFGKDYLNRVTILEVKE
jgi:OOP family OmpA-OmpF porin